jgi:hypothetical protein
MDDMGMGAPDTGMEPDMGDEATESEGFEPKDDFEREAKDFLDDSLPMETRIDALREAVKLCMDEDYGGGEGGSSSGEKKPAGGLALIFGPKKKG